MSPIVNSAWSPLLKSDSMSNLFWIARCRCIFLTKFGYVRCNLTTHDTLTLHKAWVQESRLHIRWTDEDARNAKKELYYTKSSKPLIGYRAWRLHKNYNLKQEWLLRSITADFIWEGPIVRTTEPPSSSLIGEGVPLGIHSYKNPGFLQKYLCLWSTYPIYGIIELSGVVIEHELGYRAEIATVKELFIWFNIDNEAIPSLERTYQCTVNSTKDFNKFLTDETYSNYENGEN